jgi:hypothetical protein
MTLLYELPTWLFYVGWFASQFFKLTIGLFLLVTALNKAENTEFI